ncbi:MAG: prolipoprotein diacylglyceryl transferase [Candidatus Fonsibacter ubiquis]|jgi:phosphatidylglycerol:prolipoprotein diacylglycerol transferase|uniref:prolipoprotein diacylglyceryl transferase n=1 Tax=Candidatus Fonsibacter ubiquis TaxID=1925548 RepID=UPI00013EE759|nr:prolipoprotein diacylglyceryl transferase [Candidatus Fonsibacter ubiquis]NCW70576.1 prolipoprotein diacylglyceryl transferase [Pseudomonadota bacterium]GBL34310.1 prolipoprotein diacylglyceryl transferase [Pelagibacterales bacterium]NCU44819.1 prolipoprotein diacylglyceryl transferase [Candidatus Fonsibacter ubiquis]NCU45802.1 prolipoprotein diacylglyceryl transferase [Candidatus Fonsibacter ubiquis]NCU47524.1 prolipoprotein diacylglyceryl transferase [Candidatus Fonsibacter ubiquis]
MYIHNLDPIIINFGFLEIRWYSLAYIFGIFLGFYYAKYLIKKFWYKENINVQVLDNFLIYLILGIILGGRLGYILFYNFNYYYQNPLEILFLWRGGMSFHGGVIGVLIASLIFAKKNNVKILVLTDIVVCATPIGIFLGRIANFINGELYGKKTFSDYGVIFPKIDMEPRHPSQLYEAILEGLILFFLLNIILKFKKKLFNGELSCYFLIFYSIFRIISELFREPDKHIGYIIFNISLGTIISFSFLIFGIIAFKIIKNESFRKTNL